MVYMNGKKTQAENLIHGGKIPVFKILLLCVVSVAGNVLLNYLVNGVTRLPLYLDTVFTAAICFTAGFIPGIITGILIPALLVPFKYIFLFNYPLETSWPVYFFFICALGEIILICLFYKKIKPVENEFLKNLSEKKPFSQSFIPLATQLLFLAAIACVLISILGGIVGYTVGLLSMPRSLYPEDTFLLSLLRNDVPHLASEILSRIPINTVDRFIVIFGGYGISLLFKKWLAAKKAPVQRI